MSNSFFDTTEETFTLQNEKLIEKTKKSVEITKENLETLKKTKENYLKFIENYFTNLETTLENQYKTLNSNVNVLQQKEAKDLEEILQIAKQIETIHENKKTPFTLKYSDENFEKTVKNSIRLFNKDEKVPIKIYSEIDLFRHCNWKTVKSLCEKFDEYDDLLIKAWKAEAMKSLDDKNYKKIAEEIILTTETKDSYQMLGIAKAFVLLEDEDSAFKWFEKSSNDGNSYGDVNIAFSYENGLGCKKNVKKAFKFYQLSASKGNIRGIYNLACCYEEGEICETDLPKSHELYEKAAKAGFAMAQYNLALQFEDGIGCTMDIDSAKKWLQAGAEIGYQESIELLKDYDDQKDLFDNSNNSDSDSTDSISS